VASGGDCNAGGQSCKFEKQIENKNRIYKKNLEKFKKLDTILKIFLITCKFQNSNYL